MKRSILIILIITMVVSMVLFGVSCKTTTTETTAAETTAAATTAAATTAAETTAAETTAAEQMFFVHCGLRGGAPYRLALEPAMIKIAEENNIKFTEFDSNFDVEKGIAQVEDAIALKPDVIIFAPIDAQAYVAPIKKAFEAGIPAVAETANLVEDGWPYMKAFVGGDNVVMGEMTCELLIDGMKKKFGDDLTGRVIVSLLGNVGEDGTILREEGFKKRLAEIAPEVEVIDAQNCPAWSKESGIKVMENYLAKYKKIDGVFSEWEVMALGAIDTVESAGRLDEMVFASLGGSMTETLDYIKAGKLYGIALLSPFLCAQVSMDVSMKLARGEEVEFWNYTESPKVTSENVDEFIKAYAENK